MRIAFASGKGGAGKTTLTAQMSSVWPRECAVCDFDVEAPNLHLFLRPTEESSQKIFLPVPSAVTESCTHCGKCRQICRFGAIAQFGQKIAVFSDMCHGCGGCFAVCEANALVPSNRLLGRIYEGHCLERQAYFLGGETRIGEVMTPPLLRAMLDVLKKVPKECDVLLDCPPGVSCPVVTVARQVDGIVLVVDPTPFGFSDFTLASEGMRKLGKRMGCVINRAYMPGNERGEEKVLAFCAQEGLPVFGMIPFSKEAALRTSEGKLLVDQESFRGLFTDVAKGMIEYFSEVGRG